MRSPVNGPRYKKDLRTKSEVFQHLEIGEDVLEKELEKETASKAREKSGDTVIDPREEKGSRRKMATIASQVVFLISFPSLISYGFLSTQ